MSAVVLRSALGDLDVSEAFLRLPARGNWVGHLELGWPEAPVGAASLRLTRDDGTVDVFACTIRRSGVAKGAERVSVTLVGGAGQLVLPVPPRDHAQGTAPVPAGLILRGIADAAGERLAPGVEDALDATLLPRWTRAAMPAGAAIDLLAYVLGLGWRVLTDGTVWVGSETWPTVDASTYAPVGDPRDGAVVYAPEGAPLLPGTTIDGAKASLVEYIIAPGRARARVTCELAGEPVVAPDLTLYRACYAGEVRAQDAAGGLDIALDDARMPQLRAVPLRLGIPGAKATVPEGARVRVAFEGADPRGAFASALDQDLASTKAFALVGDHVAAGTLTGVAPPSGGPVTFTYTAPDGSVSSGPSVSLAGTISGPGHRYLE